MTATKIATCCYCGSRAALVLRGQSRHELSCQTCGAPLHMMKMFPVAAPMPARQRQAAPSQDRALAQAPRKAAPPVRKRKGKSLGRKVFSEIWDAIEDIFD